MLNKTTRITLLLKNLPRFARFTLPCYVLYNVPPALSVYYILQYYVAFGVLPSLCYSVTLFCALHLVPWLVHFIYIYALLLYIPC
jgi:hypothetical protein